MGGVGSDRDRVPPRTGTLLLAPPVVFSQRQKVERWRTHAGASLYSPARNGTRERARARDRVRVDVTHLSLSSRCIDDAGEARAPARCNDCASKGAANWSSAAAKMEISLVLPSEFPSRSPLVPAVESCCVEFVSPDASSSFSHIAALKIAFSAAPVRVLLDLGHMPGRVGWG